MNAAIDRVAGLVSMGVGCTEQEFRDALAEAWDQCVHEVHDLGWLHDFAKSDALERNPYRPSIPSVQEDPDAT